MSNVLVTCGLLRDYQRGWDNNIQQDVSVVMYGKKQCMKSKLKKYIYKLFFLPVEVRVILRTLTGHVAWLLFDAYFTLPRIWPDIRSIPTKPLTIRRFDLTVYLVRRSCSKRRIISFRRGIVKFTNQRWKAVQVPHYRFTLRFQSIDWFDSRISNGLGHSILLTSLRI